MTLEGDTIDARATFSKQNTATKTSLCLGMMYFQRCGIYIWSACEFICGLLVSFEFNETGNIKHLQLPVYTLVRRRCLNR